MLITAKKYVLKSRENKLLRGWGNVFENKHGLVKHPDPGRNPEGSSLHLIMKAWPEVLTDVGSFFQIGRSAAPASKTQGLGRTRFLHSQSNLIKNP